MDGDIKKTRNPNPRENAFPLSAATFCYTIPTFIKGFKRDLDESDLTETLSEHRSDYLGNKIEKYWKAEEERAKKKNTTPSLQRTLLKAFGWEFLAMGIVLILSETVRLYQPIILGRLVRYFDMYSKKTPPTKLPEMSNASFTSDQQNVNETIIQPLLLRRLLAYYSPQGEPVSIEEAYYFATGIVLCSLISVLLVHPYMLAVCHIGMKMRIACCSLIYRKALRLSKTALGETTAGQIVNLLSNDVNRFDLAVIFAHQLWLAPVETVICTYFMYMEIGVSAIIGVAVLVASVPLQRVPEPGFLSGTVPEGNETQLTVSIDKLPLLKHQYHVLR
ncbi:ATP-binding cassette sub-family C member 4-like, partial [Diabrotica undecimpunctata]|uniref:ATP-binding cassette sub-family C member 4-like n=1 Tax=Diabrotica undecimpunctata TaxID=50387 RepID=UPI003B6421E1